MAKWKLFGKPKTKEDEVIEPEETIEETEETIDETEEIIEPEPEPEEKQPLDEYHETLETGSSSKTAKTTQSSDQRVWRDVNAIEEKIDNLHKTRAQKPVTELDKKVDKLISKRKRK